MSTESEGLYATCPTGWEQFRSSWDVRDEHIRQYGFAVLAEALIEDLRTYAPFVEVGCGTGYWAHKMLRAGIDIIATDPKPPNKPGVNAYSFARTYGIILPWDGVKAARASAGKRTLLMVWPDYDSKWPVETLRAYTGDTVVYVGEEVGGCTGDDAFHEELGARWYLIEELIIPQFNGIHDAVYVYRRRYDEY